MAGSNIVNRLNHEIRTRNMYELLVENINKDQLARLFPQDFDSAIRLQNREEHIRKEKG